MTTAPSTTARPEAAEDGDRLVTRRGETSIAPSVVATVAQRRLERLRDGVVACVVGHDSFDADAVTSEELDGVLQKRRAGLTAFIAVCFDERDPAVIVDSDVEEVVADLAVPAV